MGGGGVELDEDQLRYILRRCATKLMHRFAKVSQTVDVEDEDVDHCQFVERAKHPWETHDRG